MCGVFVECRVMCLRLLNGNGEVLSDTGVLNKSNNEYVSERAKTSRADGRLVQKTGLCIQRENSSYHALETLNRVSRDDHEELGVITNALSLQHTQCKRRTRRIRLLLKRCYLTIHSESTR